MLHRINIGRTTRTLRHLRPKQFSYYVWRRGLQPGISQIKLPAVVERRDAVGCVPRPCPCAATEADFEFTFVGQTKTFAGGIVDWQSAGQSRLWRYNLHYFDYLLDETKSRAARDHLIDHWIESNPPGTANAWEPYTASLRIVNWIDYFLRTADRRPLKEAWLSSLYGQALWLERNVEHHILANHYLKNTVAQFFAGAFFAGADADRWLEQALSTLQAEADEQMLPDGGHYERSPMYHSIATQDFIDVVNLIQSSDLGVHEDNLAPLMRVAQAGMQFLRDILHPDGEIPLFNDSAFAIALSPRILLDYGAGIIGFEAAAHGDGHGVITKTDCGYFGFRAGNDFLMIDCGAVGPDYQPGHAHCDMLSFELSLNGRRVIVDSGVSGYDNDDLRAYVRSTAAHNTVQLDDVDQSEVWSSFRVGRRARPLTARLEQEPNGELLFTGAHDGYRHLRQRAVHERQVRCQPEAGIFHVRDCIAGSGAVRAKSFLHIHPDFEVAVESGRLRIFETDGDCLLEIVPDETCDLSLIEGRYCPQFGVSLKNQVIVLEKRGALPFDINFTIGKTKH